jgi:hypothetical protein
MSAGMGRSIRALTIAFAAGLLTTAAACSLLVDTGDLSSGATDDAGGEASPTPPPPANDGALPSTDGAVDAGTDAPDASGRVTDGLVALYTFTEASGTTLRDVSGVAPALDATFIGVDGGPPPVFGADGLTITQPAFVHTGTASKVFTAVAASHEATLEVWMTPVDTTQGISRIVGVAGTFGNVDLLLFQDGNVYKSNIRKADGTGLQLASPTGSVSVKKSHLVATRLTDSTRILYLDGIEMARDTGSADPAQWDTGFALTMANTASLDGAFLGKLHLVAFYARALTATEIERNHAAGDGR